MPKILQIALPTPLRRMFDYLPPIDSDVSQWIPGVRVKVPFGRRELVGILMNVADNTSIPSHKLKTAITLLDQIPVFNDITFQLAQWAAAYYHHPIGEVMLGVLPTALRKGHPAQLTAAIAWMLTETGQQIDPILLKKAPRQMEAMQLLKNHPQGIGIELIKLCAIETTVLNTLEKKGWIRRVECHASLPSAEIPIVKSMPLNDEQQTALDFILKSLSQFQVFLLEGITGSGKTEIYLQAIEAVLAKGEQALVLVPEIALTPQTIQRFEERFQQPVVTLHSKLTEQQRLRHWLLAKHGDAKIIIGTRSALFTPLPRLGIIVIDEEHDASFKQHEGFRYSARDLAVLRAQMEKIPVVLGSATPSLESLQHAQRGRYQSLQLTKRANQAVLPTYHLIDLKHQKITSGLSQTLIDVMKHHLSHDGQVLLFLNRRGFSPVFLCHDCGWISSCIHCDAKLHYHKRKQQLQCHHCHYITDIPSRCPDCQSKQLMPLGYGTERIEQTISTLFPTYPSVRIDRDATSKKGSLTTLLEKAHSGKARILIGTQMLAKGHHFPDVTLVAMLNVDHALLSQDFRGAERFGQLFVQVAGRAGRAERRGEVYIQSYYPEHPLLKELLERGYSAFSKTLLKEREIAQLPPFSHFALIRAESIQPALPLRFLSQLKTLMDPMKSDRVTLLGPVDAVMARKQGRHRAQLLIQSSERRSIQQLLPKLIEHIEKMALKQQLRWAIDVDPYEVV